MKNEKLAELRPLVHKHYQYFLAALKTHGSDTVRKVLKNGRCGGTRLTFKMSNKDRFQMLQLMGLI